MDLINSYRNPEYVKALSIQIKKEAKQELNIMEICGGHTHTIMKYGLMQLLPECINFVHGPGCPVCVMPKERIDEAIELAQKPNVILATLGDMIRVPGSKTSLQVLRAEGYDIRALYSPLDILKIAKENPDKKVIFFAIGFETTTPMSAVLIDKVIHENIKNILFHINHLLVPPPIHAIMSEKANIDAFLGPSHVSVITGYGIFEPITAKYKTPVVVSGFEPSDVMDGVLRIVRQFNEGRREVENEYSRAVNKDGNMKAKELINRYLEEREVFRWRGIGDIPKSALKLKDEFAHLDAERVFELPKKHIDDHKLCICGEILRGRAKPPQCKVFGKACTPKTPIGSCMVSSEGACAAYFKYGKFLRG
ncbi:MAG: hydrogenase formation protein HypD [Campylobacteraceae bacterium]|nr:hydrogenase formation protein HypD [Campylobacteraceae bacterium]